MASCYREECVRHSRWQFPKEASPYGQGRYARELDAESYFRVTLSGLAPCKERVVLEMGHEEGTEY